MESLIDWLTYWGSAYADLWWQLPVGLAVIVVLLRWNAPTYRRHQSRRIVIPASIGGDRSQRHEVEIGTTLECRVEDFLSATSTDETAPKFHFRFEGEACKGNALTRGHDVRLIFGEGSTEAARSIVFRGKRFLALFGRNEARLTIVVWPSEGLDVKGPEVAVARFVNSRLVSEVSFDLHVRNDSPDQAKVMVEFFANGTRLYGLSVSTLIQSIGSDLPATAQLLSPLEVDLDMPNALSAARAADSTIGELLLKLSLNSGRLNVTLAHRKPGGHFAYVNEALITSLDKGSLQTLLAQIRTEMGADFYGSDVWEKATLPGPNEMTSGDLAECFERVASAGSLLYQALSGTKDGAQLFEHINSQPDGTRLTIATSQVFLPFEIMYPRKFSKTWPDERKRQSQPELSGFWGARFAIEILRAGEGDYSALLEQHSRAPRAVSFNLNDTIKATELPSPNEIHKCLESELEQRGVRCTVSNSCDAMKQILLGAETAANLVYVYCHGSAADPSIGSLEELQLDHDCSVSPTSMYPDTRYASAPVVFLNACYSSASSPLFFTGFLEAFCRQGALGLIATSFPVPIMFGAQFGSDVIRECLFGSDSLGERMRRLRVKHGKQGNPVPLFYSVQCQLGT